MLRPIPPASRTWNVACRTRNASTPCLAGIRRSPSTNSSSVCATTSRLRAMGWQQPEERSEPIRVMRIISRMNIGGPATHVVLLNAGLDCGGYDCLLVTGSEGASEGSLRDLAVENDLRLAIIPELGREIAPWSDFVTLVKLYRFMRRERPHVVHTHTAKAGFVGRIAARLAGVPVVLHTFHGHVFHGYFSPAKTQLFLLIERLGARLSTRIITISPRLREEIAQFGVTGRERIEVIPLGFELDAFAAQARAIRGSGRSLRLPPDAKL